MVKMSKEEKRKFIDKVRNYKVPKKIMFKVIRIENSSGEIAYHAYDKKLGETREYEYGDDDNISNWVIFKILNKIPDYIFDFIDWTDDLMITLQESEYDNGTRTMMPGLFDPNERTISVLFANSKKPYKVDIITTKRLLSEILIKEIEDIKRNIHFWVDSYEI